MGNRLRTLYWHGTAGGGEGSTLNLNKNTINLCIQQVYLVALPFCLHNMVNVLVNL